MAASFRNTSEILELAGCDLLTISPALLDELQKNTGRITRKLDPAQAAEFHWPRMTYNEKEFRWALNENQMAREKLAEGIRLFAADTVKLERFLSEKLDSI